MNIEIRRAAPADSAGIVHVQVTSYRAAYARFFPSSYFEQMTEGEQTQDWRDLLGAPGADPVFVAVTTDNELVGYALGKVKPEEFEPWECELVALHVLPQYQRRGIGSKLFSRMVREMQALGKTVIFLWTIEGNPVRTFYERLGGVLAGGKEYDIDDVTVTEVAYSWTDLDDLRAKLYLK